jgi:hypothetical protein
MALPTYPIAIPATSSIVAYDRNSLAYFFTNRQTLSTQPAVAGMGVGALGIPLGSTVYAVPANRNLEGSTLDTMIQIDAYSVSSTQGPSATVTIYGSLDAVQFYNMVAVAVVTAGTLTSLSKLITPGVKPKYITAGVTAYAGAGGVTDSVSAGLFV